MSSVVFTLYMPYLLQTSHFVGGTFVASMNSVLVWVFHMSFLMWETIKVYMPLPDHFWHANVAPNSGMPHNKHIVLHAAEQLMLCTSRLQLLVENSVAFWIKNKQTFTSRLLIAGLALHCLCWPQFGSLLYHFGWGHVPPISSSMGFAKGPNRSSKCQLQFSDKSI